MEGWGKIGVQRSSVLYPNSCYNEPCYIEVQVYVLLVHLDTNNYDCFVQLLLKFKLNVLTLRCLIIGIDDR